jgi:hypothetical protein
MATRAKGGGGSGGGGGGETNAHEHFAKGLFVQVCPACVLRACASCVRPVCVLRASCVRPACVLRACVMRIHITRCSVVQFLRYLRE